MCLRNRWKNKLWHSDVNRFWHSSWPDTVEYRMDKVNSMEYKFIVKLSNVPMSKRTPWEPPPPLCPGGASPYGSQPFTKMHGQKVQKVSNWIRRDDSNHRWRCYSSTLMPKKDDIIYVILCNSYMYFYNIIIMILWYYHLFLWYSPVWAVHGAPSDNLGSKEYVRMPMKRSCT